MEKMERLGAYKSSNLEYAVGKENTLVVAVYEMLRVKMLKEVIFQH